MTVQLSVAMSVNAPVENAFNVAAGFDARELVQRWGPLPGIAEVEGHDGPWSAVGQKRRHLLTDNSSVREELTDFTRNYTFAYSLSDFTGPFKTLVKKARAEWHFTQLASAKTQIDWTYVFTPNGPIAEPVLWFFVKTCWPGYLRAALRRVKEKTETQYNRAPGEKVETDFSHNRRGH